MSLELLIFFVYAYLTAGLGTVALTCSLVGLPPREDGVSLLVFVWLMWPAIIVILIILMKRIDRLEW